MGNGTGKNRGGNLPMVIFRSGNLSKKVEIDNAKVVFLLELVVIINES